ncbi:hypothetical protein NDU88_006327, partial [Pleurodeles waltl]
GSNMSSRMEGVTCDLDMPSPVSGFSCVLFLGTRSQSQAFSSSEASDSKSASKVSEKEVSLSATISYPHSSGVSASDS